MKICLQNQGFYKTTLLFEMFKTLKPTSTSTISSNALLSTSNTKTILQQELYSYQNRGLRLYSNDLSTSFKLFKRYVQSTTKKDTLNYILQNKISQKQNKMKEDLSKLTVKSLKSQLRLYNLKVSGNKPELIERLTNHNLNQNSSILNATSHPNETKIFTEIKKSIKSPMKGNSSKTNVIRSASENSKIRIRSIKSKTDLFLTKETVNKGTAIVGVDITKFIINKAAKSAEGKLQTTEVESTKEMSEFLNTKNNESTVLSTNVIRHHSPITSELYTYKEIRLEDLPDYNIASKEKIIVLSIVLFSLLWITFGVGTL